MKTALHISSSIFLEHSQSGQLSRQFVQDWQKNHPQGRVIERNLAANPLAHLDAERFAAFIAAPEARDERQKSLVAESDALIEELRQADIIVLGLPMYNFGIPSQLKAYLDNIARAGQTFKYTATGPIGLLTDKPVIIFASRGGFYQGTEKDSQTRHVKDFFAFLGITSLKFVYAEGLNIGEEQKTKALQQARAESSELATLLAEVCAV